MKFFRVPKFVRLIFSKRIWGFSCNENSVYLTFDDGPHPDITPFVLDELKKYNAKATFFCVGNNVLKYPLLYQRILEEGHQVGNHTYYHEKSSNVPFSDYKKSIVKAAEFINTNLFRPPYGRLNLFKARSISKNYKIVMWTWLSYDYDNNVSIEKILSRAKKEITKGDIIVLHDNPKIADRQKIILPLILQLLTTKGFNLDIINSD